MIVSKAATFRNIIYTTCGKGIALVCFALANLVVARNLKPEDYGVVGFASIIIGFLGQFSDMGVANAVIRRREINRQSLQTAFTLKLVLGAGAFGVSLVIAPFARHLFDHPATGNVIRVLAFTFLVGAIGFLPQVTLTRDMNYRALVIPGVAAALAQCILAVTFVRLGWSYWAVVIGSVGSTLASGIVLQLSTRSSIRLRFDWEDAREYLRFGIPLFAAGILTFVIFNIDNFLVGSVMGSAQLGYYALAFTWGSFICILLRDTVNNVLFPAFSAIQHDAAAIRRWYLKTVDLVAFVALVANSSLLANAHWFLVTFLGKGTGKWLPAVASLQILCVYGILRAVTEPVGPCLMARGETRMILRANLLMGAVEVLSLLFALRSGRIEVVALAVLGAYACAGFVLLPFLRREFSITSRDIVARIWPVVPALVVASLVTSLLPDSFGMTMITLAARGLITASAVGLTHGLCTQFRCFHEASGMISQNLARARA